MILPPLPDIVLEPIVRMALAEDFGRAGDLTADAIFDVDTMASFVVRARGAGVLSGVAPAQLALKMVDARAQFLAHMPEGSQFAAGDIIATISGPVRACLMAERTILNFLGPLSATATLTAQFVAAIAHTKAKIAATRKTLPGLRALQKRAVLHGGGTSHRYGLDDAVLIKDNHIAAAGSITNALTKARAIAGHLTAVEIEVDTIAGLEEALSLKPDVIMLDNFRVEDLAEAVSITAGKVTLEASGGVNLASVAAIAETGVDYISAGALTHSAGNVDIGLDAV